MPEVLAQEGSWVEPSSNRKFHFWSWQPSVTRAVLVIVHGFGEHGGRYKPVAQALAEQGIWVVVPDLWGHGLSGGIRGDLTVRQCVADLQALTTKVFLPASEQVQYALFGHSFGGLVAINWLLSQPVNLRCAIIQSPLLEVAFPVPRWKTTAALLLARCWPTCSLPMNLDAEALSHDPKVVQSYRTDTLVHNLMSARTYSSIQTARYEAFDHARTLQVPVLLLCGLSDRIVSVEAARRWFNQLQCEKRSVTFPNAYHELHNEPIRGQILSLVSEWTLEHMKAADAR